MLLLITLNNKQTNKEVEATICLELLSVLCCPAFKSRVYPTFSHTSFKYYASL